MLLSRFKIVGHSMEPMYKQGDSVIASSIPHQLFGPRLGQVVVFENSGEFFIKRITKIKENKYFLTGDNKSDSFDSRKVGFIERHKIKGKVIIKI